MLVRDSVWDKIRTRFDFQEKIELTNAISGQVICPKGFIIDAEKLTEPLRSKIQEAIS